MRKKISFLIFGLRLILPLFLICSSALQADPEIFIKSPTVEAGTSVEGVKEILPFHFSFRNSGTSPLHVYRIVPSCGCTKINKYDSLVMQGKSGSIDGQLNLKDYAISGPITKIITVYSDAGNDSILRLAVKATVRSIIEIREPYISINERDSARKSFEVLSRSDSLKISAVTFRRDPDGSASGQSVWKSDIPVPISFRWIRVDTVRSDTYKVYRLTLIMPSISESMLGEFRIQTSRVDKPELYLHGTLLK